MCFSTHNQKMVIWLITIFIIVHLSLYLGVQLVLYNAFAKHITRQHFWQYTLGGIHEDGETNDMAMDGFPYRYSNIFKDVLKRHDNNLTISKNEIARHFELWKFDYMRSREPWFTTFDYYLREKNPTLYKVLPPENKFFGSLMTLGCIK
jgi:hypothetical protein